MNNGDIDLSKINPPLIFSFTKSLIAKYKPQIKILLIK